MKKVFLYILLGVVVVVVVISIVIPPKNQFGTLAKIEVPGKNDVKSDLIKNVTFIIDNSGSMQGYINFSGNQPEFKDAKPSLPSKVGDFMSNCTNILQANTVAECNRKIYDMSQMMIAFNNYSAFSGPITEVNKLFEIAASKVSSDSSICVVVSDLVLSHGPVALRQKKDIYLNFRNLAGLKTSIRNQFYKLKNEDKGVLIVKYESEFNGKYYYNYTENQENCTFKDSLMQKRPFYVVAIGKTKALKQLCNSGCIPGGYTQIFTSLSLDKEDMMVENYSVSQPSEQPQWTLGCPDAKKMSEASNLPFSLSMGRNIKTVSSKFSFTFPQFTLPIYVNDTIVPEFDTSVLTSVSNLTDLKSFDVVTRPYEELPKVANLTVTFKSNQYVDFSQSSTLDDIKISMTELEGKTWGFEAIIEALYEVYSINENSFNTVATTKFTIFKQ